MKPVWRGVTLAVVQIAIVLSMGAKLLADRARYPRVWAESAAYDPDALIRGRYLSLRLQVKVVATANGGPNEAAPSMSQVRLGVEKGQLVAHPTSEITGLMMLNVPRRGLPGQQTVLQEPVLFFIPEHAADPTRHPAEEELWVEVTVPPKGPPRPIRLGIKKNGAITPLALD